MSQDHVWMLIPAQSLKVKKDRDLVTGEVPTKAPANGDCNYDNPKVAKVIFR